MRGIKKGRAAFTLTRSETQLATKVEEKRYCSRFPPIFPLKCLIPVAGMLLLIQGVAEIIRCGICIRNGAWPQRLHDVEEMETVILHEQEYLREHEKQDRHG
jgi:hypothetical protein